MKPGYKTTEFLSMVAFVVGVVTAAAADVLPARYAAIGAAVSVAAYAVSRGLAKVYPPKPGP